MMPEGGTTAQRSQVVLYDEVKKCTNNFSESNQIGSGGYGKVYRGVLSTGQVVAIKRALQGSMQGGLEFKTEIELLSRVHHKNLVSLVGFCFEQGEQMLVYDFMANGTLRESLSVSPLISTDCRYQDTNSQQGPGARGPHTHVMRIDVSVRELVDTLFFYRSICSVADLALAARPDAARPPATAGQRQSPWGPEGPYSVAKCEDQLQTSHMSSSRLNGGGRPQQSVIHIILA
ncbi:putative leucine-rich repeat receptor-like protein kinase [Sesamum angolense]|uniref:Leucine-rich repeat receptor-like protein kinase n=1 Tax=Sesamum angolense TaxID=2727404 RepID=A0AAE1T5Q0_9LAMI|nr:putative leucine-rich repeat receptor-like protein kinase [Sesamum angolense]